MTDVGHNELIPNANAALLEIDAGTEQMFGGCLTYGKVLSEALKRGLLVRQLCEVCGDVKTDAHHPDYALPLLVEWLCSKHHRAAHAKSNGSRRG